MYICTEFVVYLAAVPFFAILTNKSCNQDILSLNFLLQLQIGVEFEASTRMQDTTTSFGYQLDLPKANLLFKGKHK